MYENILIATDGSEVSGRGVEAGLRLAKATGARVTVVTVSEPFPTYDFASSMGLFADNKAREAYEANCSSAADAILTTAREAAAAAGVACETVYVDNSTPARAIIDAAKARSCDLIVLASHGRDGFERFLIGSQASRVVQNAETSVLVVR